MKIPTYWFCFTISFAIVAMLPVWYFRMGRDPKKSLAPLVSGYDHPAFNESWRLGTFLAHMIVASVLALILVQIIHRRSRRNRTDTKTSIQYFLILTTIAAAFIAILTSLNISLPYALGCLIPVAGYVASSSLVAWFEITKDGRRDNDIAG